jgi:polysaccharide biosynthesis transport protein
MPMPDRAGLGIYLRTLRRRWVLAVCIVAAAVLTGLAVAELSSPTYTATAEVLLGQDKRVDALLGTAGYTQDPERELNTGLRLITLEPIADGVRRSLHLSERSGVLASRITTALDRNSSIVSITAQGSDAGQAARIANAFAEGYRDYRAATARASVEDAVATARARLAGEPNQQLDRELRGLEVAAAAQTGGVEVVHHATAATAARRPRPLVSAFAAGFLGLLAAAITIVVLARTDRRIDDEEELERIAGRPVTALVPDLGEQTGPAMHEALVSVAMSLPASHEPCVVLVTGPGPDDDAKDATLGLATAFASIGRRVLAIEADLRKPAFAGRLEIVETPGLAAVLAGETTLEGELITFAGVGDHRPGRAWALPAGLASDAPHGPLASDAMAELVTDATNYADVVLLASAPVGVVADALPLARLADVVVLVARLGVTRADLTMNAVRALRGVGAPPVLLVAAAGRAPGRLRRALRWRVSGAAVQTSQERSAERAEPEVTAG